MQISTAERLLGVMGYLGILYLIPLKAKRDSMFVQFHSRQGGVLFFLWLIASILLVIILFFVDSIAIAANIILGSLIFLFTVYIVMVLIGIFKVALGERYRMPVVADVALMLGL
jgi:uncharacterized membrane protein